ncbi:HNH endonuclease [Methylibium sp.]|uniref:HNH endonuclease n=1 Tax=Methylibium sp. TaxID=2067992 RepID=UPI0017DEE63E|nr:HNH endonuclease [Methylibium sp.]MBA3588205.1 HNH endonuclease [Methylibium sp.]
MFDEQAPAVRQMRDFGMTWAAIASHYGVSEPTPKNLLARVDGQCVPRPYGKRPTPLLDLFNARVVRANGCWGWVGAKHGFGYGWCGTGSDKDLAHRVAYRLFLGEIPAGMCVMHACDNPACTNPAHLKLGTQAENQADKVSKGRQYRGERHHCYGKRSWKSHLTDEGELNARRMLAEGHKRAEIASALGVSYSVIRRVDKRARQGVHG